jgi:nickel transport protein
MKRIPVLLFLLAALPADAHDLWLEKEAAGLTLLQGHRHSAHGGADTLPYEPGFVREALCLEDSGRSKSLAAGRTAPWKVATDCAALLVSVSSGYWSKTPWETRNLPKDQVSGALKSWLSEESVKRIARWSPGTDRPLGKGLEITPATDPLALKPGDKLVVLVTDDGKPKAGLPVAYGGDTRGATGEDGRIAIRIRQGGVQLISTSLETPLTDGKADQRIRSAALQFDLPR